MELQTEIARKALRELEALRRLNPDNLLLSFDKELLSLCEAFGLSGQSGGSAPYVAEMLAKNLKELLLHQPIAPVTGEESEWVVVEEGLWQNNRCWGLFKHGLNTPHYLDAIVFEDQQGFRFSSSDVRLPDGQLLVSRQYVRTFPFTPKTFYVKVVSEQTAPGWWEHRIEDMEQLEAVRDYYLFTTISPKAKQP